MLKSITMQSYYKKKENKGQQNILIDNEKCQKNVFF